MGARLRQVVFLLILLSLLAVPRLIGLDRFATIDEPYWLTAGSDFYYALGQRDFARTVYDYHPAVTTTWIITAGMLLYFPQYRGLGQGYFDVYKDSLESFLLSHDRTPLGLLTTARLVQVVIIVFLLLVLFWFLRRLLGAAVAWCGILLVSFDPFFLGHSRLLNHEGMLSLLVLISLLALLAYHRTQRCLAYLVLSGAAAGFAQLTKSSSVVLFLVIGLLFVLDMTSRRGQPWRQRLLPALRDLGLWLAALVVVYVVFWPGMWVAPGQMLYQVFGNAFSYAFGGSRLAVTGSAEPAPLHFGFQDFYSLLWGMLWRTTPVAWLGFLLFAGLGVRQGGTRRLVLLSLLLLGISFIVLFGVAGGRNSAHYLLTAYVVLDILAGAGYVYAVAWLVPRLPSGWNAFALPVVSAIAVLIQASSALSYFPYYYTYFNPVMEAWESGRQDPNYGYGEGLDLAAAYLTRQPDAARSTVIAFYGRGAFSYFYPGTTEPLKTVYADAENVPQLLDVIHHSQYIVLYYQLEHQRNSPANLMGALDGLPPEHSIWMNGIEYIRIYRVQDLPQDFYTSLAP